MKRLFLGLAMMSAGATVGAQNLIQNPGFDEDATGWDLSMYSTWSNRVDHGDSPFSGALQITTRSTDTASQCVELSGATSYDISVWVEKDPQSSISPCSSPTSGLDVQFFDGPSCAGTETSRFASAHRQPEPDGWQDLGGSFTTDASTKSALLTLSGQCRTNGTGIAIHYFDDINISPDVIFHTDFELHAPEGGPDQPPGG